MKLLILVLASKENHYTEKKKLWENISVYYKNKFNTETYFLYNEGPQRLEYQDFYADHNESYPNMLHKTIDAIEFFSYINYDYIIRTNLTSIINLKLFINLIENNIPKTNVYFGVMINDPFHVTGHRIPLFVSGACILMSKDICKRLIENKNFIFRSRMAKFVDDLAIGDFLKPTQEDKHFCDSLAKRKDFRKFSSYLESNDNDIINNYHFRIKFNENRNKEVEVMTKIFDKIVMLDK